MGILDTIFGDTYRTPGINPDASMPTQQSQFPNLFFTPDLSQAGLLTPEQQSALASQASKSGAVTGIIDFLTQPRNLGAGSALPYALKAYGTGMGTASDVYGLGLNQLFRTQLAGQKSPYGAIDISKFTPESVKAFEESGRQNFSLLKPMPAATGTQAVPVQLQNLYEEKYNALQQDPENKLLQNQVRALEKELGLAPEEPLARGEEVKKELTPLETKADELAAKELVAFNIGGGFSDAQKSLTQLDTAINQLETTPEGTITGTRFGYTPDWLKPMFDKEAVTVKDQVEEIVQRNLRLILGAQFTEREGTRLIERAYNPKLSQAENARRLKLLQQQIYDAASNKQQAYDYFQDNGTLKGFEGTLYTQSGQFLEDYNSRIGEQQQPQQQPTQQQPRTMTTPQPGAVMNGWRFKGGDPSNKNNWEKV